MQIKTPYNGTLLHAGFNNKMKLTTLINKAAIERNGTIRSLPESKLWNVPCRFIIKIKQ